MWLLNSCNSGTLSSPRENQKLCEGRMGSPRGGRCGETGRGEVRARPGERRSLAAAGASDHRMIQFATRWLESKRESVPDEIGNRHQHDADDDERDGIGNKIRKDHEDDATDQWNRRALIPAVDEEAQADAAKDQSEEKE